MADQSPYPDSNRDTGAGPGRGSPHSTPPSTPRWVKVLGIIGIVVVVLVVIALVTGLGGPHGPRRHLPARDAGGRTSSYSVIEGHTPPDGDAGGHSSVSGIMEHGIQQI